VIGYFSFTEVTADAQPAGSGSGGAPPHQAYNAWHQLDHLPQQFTLEGVRFGQRWVRSPECRAAEITGLVGGAGGAGEAGEADPAATPTPTPTPTALDRCQYMTLYLLQDEAALHRFTTLAQQLRQDGRFFSARTPHLSGPFDLEGQWVATRLKISADVVPFRPAEGIYVVVGPPVDGAAMVASHEGVAGVWTFLSKGRSIAVAFIDGDLLHAAAELGRGVIQGGLTGHNRTPIEWAGPLRRIDANQWGWFDRLTPQ
jgi:hypothetical protein